jgi:perosamine synthetase
MLSHIYPYACLNIDCSWSQWMSGLRRAIYTNENRGELLNKISSLFSTQDDVVITVCVRTAFDLYLEAIDLPKGSEVLITSINIPEMTRILRKHGLIPVPVDICVDTLVTKAERVEELITPRTKLILIAMLYGVTFDITDISKVAKKYNLLLFEDCSESYSGNSFRGNECADATVISFGPIKTATAFGGGIIIVRNEKILSKIRAIQSSYPMQSSKLYFKKLIKYSVGMLLLNTKAANIIFRRLLKSFGVDYKQLVVKIMRGFPPSKGLDIYRTQPCLGLLSFLYWRLSSVDEAVLMNSMSKLHIATKLLSENNLVVPGHKTERKIYWLYPVIAPNTTDTYNILNKSGIDAYRGISQLNKIEPPAGSSYKDIEETNKMFASLIYFPLHKDVPEKDILEICTKAIDLLNPKPRL